MPVSATGYAFDVNIDNNGDGLKLGIYIFRLFIWQNYKILMINLSTVVTLCIERSLFYMVDSTVACGNEWTLNKPTYSLLPKIQ